MNAIGELFGQALPRRLGWVLLHFVWQGAIVAAVAAGGLHLLRRRSASARYLLACAALGLLACLPLLTAWLMPELMEETASAGAPVAAAAGAGLGARPVDLPPALVLASPTAGQQPESPLPALSWPQRASRALGPALPYVVGLWVIGVLALSAWRAIGFARVRQLRSSGTLPAGESLAGEFSDLARRLGLSRPVRLMRSSLARVPVVIGWLRPVVLLPASALTGLTAEQLGAVLVHELAHVRRHDYLVNLVQTVVETLLFYHPAVWWLSSRVRAERENCCDDVAAAACPSRCAYAEALVAMARLRPARVRLAVAADGGTLLSRVRRLLAAPAEREGRPGRWLAGLIAIATVVILAVAIPLACRPARAAASGAVEGERQRSAEPARRVLVCKLKYVNAADAAATLRAHLGGAEARVVITPQPKTNALVLSGMPEDLKFATSLLARLDVPSDPAKPALPAGPAQMDARRTAEAFVSALGAGRDAEAIKLAAPGSAVARQIEAFRKGLGRRPGLRVLSVHANDTVGLARAAWTRRRRVPGSDRLILLIRLSKRPRRWMVGGIEQESLPEARAEVDEFLSKHPDAVALYATPPVREAAIYNVPKLLELLRERGSGRTNAEAGKWLTELIRAHVGKPAEWRANGGKLSQVTVADQARGVLLVSTTEANQASVRALLESLETHGRKQILAEVQALKLGPADEPQIRAWLAGQTSRKLPAGRESAFVVPDKTAAEFARRIRDAKSGEALARPTLLLLHYATGKFFTGQNIPLKLAPSGDAGARKVIIYSEVGMSIEVHAYIAADGKHIGISSEAEVTELAGANIQDRAYLKSDRPVPEKHTLVLRLPTRRYRLLGFREKLSGDGGGRRPAPAGARRRIEADKEAPAAERVDRPSGVERDFERELIDPTARPHSYVYILLKPTVLQPHVK